MATLVQRDLQLEARIWKEIPGFPYYRVSSDGLVETRRRLWHPEVIDSEWRPCKQSVGAGGYFVVKVRRSDGSKASAQVHQLVLRAFVGPQPDGHVSRHLDDNRTVNRIDNLAYGTCRDNAEDARRNGRMVVGSDHPGSKLTEDKIRRIFEMRSRGIRQAEIAKEFRCDPSNISRILARKKWRWVSV